MSTREIRYNAVAGVGYAFFVSVVILILEALANIFYPTPLVLSPIWALIKGYWVSLVLILVLYGLLILFARPYRTEEMTNYNVYFRPAQRTVIYVIIAVAILSLLFDAYPGPLWGRTRIGLFIVVNVIAGALGGYLAARFGGIKH
ncbi:hypothetical protein [Vulcanisaeta souniana]|uniref:Uncharacterized protein n=1 Tax=Vulcanisaeta souniana JCM 11219 TaxID=1293586 RepID=A0A830E7L4_9CREN|nr:hypothetical protein [Vulcanisaeta souniana]BDR91679.1 hypothetical protein Vsou_07720 [Vulcanisaeta souniana JCM 11219]GGI71364.1 hypothetical protein GCM10007112_05240 [Vulcanisaeta souniana JCM 11219]